MSKEKRRVTFPFTVHPRLNSLQSGVSYDSLQLRSRLTTLILTGDGSTASDGRCATCAIYSVECTYNDHLKVCRPNSGPFPSQRSHPNPSHQDPEGTWTISKFCRDSDVCSYVQHLEHRIANLEQVLREVHSVPCINTTSFLSPCSSTPVEMKLEISHP